ncbi:hypothetical protein QZH41_019812 [Actinostola sp. cb2023]|nr:hypothetical protein QZH41_019812 [Actinostola sp. cb2023]
MTYHQRRIPMTNIVELIEYAMLPYNLDVRTPRGLKTFTNGLTEVGIDKTLIRNKRLLADLVARQPEEENTDDDSESGKEETDESEAESTSTESDSGKSESSESDDEPRECHVCRDFKPHFKDKHKEVLRGPFEKKHSLLKPKPLKGLQKEELLGELHARKIYPHPDSTKADLEKELASQLQGIQRVPALLYCTPMSSFEDHSINTYEALACEPMHDISNHICNVLEELPNHLRKEVKAIFNETFQITLGKKDTKRACDYRYAIILFVKRLRGVLTDTLQSLLDTLVEMQEILYTDDDNISPRLILRYHNLSFMHFLMCTLEFGSSPIALTARKLYGKYLHNLVSHQSIQLRIISGTSSNAENEERIFSSIKSITKATSNYRPFPYC